MTDCVISTILITYRILYYHRETQIKQKTKTQNKRDRAVYYVIVMIESRALLSDIHSRSSSTGYAGGS